MPQPYDELVHPSWVEPLAPVADHIATAGQFLRDEVAAGRGYLPAGENVLRAFTQPFEDVRVLIVGQDPYPTPGHAMGLSFSVRPEVRPLPRSLVNIYRELGEDLGLPAPRHGTAYSTDDAIEVAREIAGKSPDAIRAAKRLLNNLSVDPAAALLAESVEQQKLLGSPNQTESVRANLEKRAPKFADA